MFDVIPEVSFQVLEVNGRYHTIFHFSGLKKLHSNEITAFFQVTLSSQNQTSITDSYGLTTEIISTSDIGKVAVTESVETTTTTTTKTTTTIRLSPSVEQKEVVKTIEPKIVSVDNKSDDSSSRETSPKGDEDNVDMQNSAQSSESAVQNGNINITQAAKSSENKVIVIGSDGKQTSGLMNIQSVCPSTAKPGTTFVVLNKEGAQMKISLAPKKMENTEKTEENKEEQENGQQSKWIFMFM